MTHGAFALDKGMGEILCYPRSVVLLTENTLLVEEGLDNCEQVVLAEGATLSP